MTLFLRALGFLNLRFRIWDPPQGKVSGHRLDTYIDVSIFRSSNLSQPRNERNHTWLYTTAG